MSIAFQLKARKLSKLLEELCTPAVLDISPSKAYENYEVQRAFATTNDESLTAKIKSRQPGLTVTNMELHRGQVSRM